MGLWADIAGGAAMVGGVLAAPFTGGLSIPAGISAGGAIIASGSVNDAANKQATATDQALALQGRMYDTTRSDLAPYASAGTGALGNLRQLAGVPSAPQPNPPGPAGSGSPFDLAGIGPTGYHGGGAPTMNTNPSAPVATPGKVLMQAPDGSTQAVDPSQVSHFQQRGAQVMNASGFSPRSL